MVSHRLPPLVFPCALLSTESHCQPLRLPPSDARLCNLLVKDSLFHSATIYVLRIPSERHERALHQEVREGFKADMRESTLKPPSGLSVESSKASEDDQATTPCHLYKKYIIIKDIEVGNTTVTTVTTIIVYYQMLLLHSSKGTFFTKVLRPTNEPTKN